MASASGAVVDGGDAARVNAVAGDARPARACGACGRTFDGKAGRVVDGRPVCPACGNRLRPKVACGACGRPTARPRREAGTGVLICEGCLHRDTHATCRRCRKHRRVAARDAEGGPLCAGCASEAPATHACPDCSKAVPGRGGAPCDACSLRSLIARRLAAQADAVQPAWARAMYEAFQIWDGLPRDQYGVVRQAAAYARVFAAIGAGCAGPEEVTQERLLELLGNEGLRRAMTVVRFLVAHLSLTWSAGTAEEAAEGRRIRAVLAACDGRPWTAGFRAYHRHLAEHDPPLAPKTIRTYLTAAAGLLDAAKVDRAADLEERHARVYLLRRGGHRANLARFAAWLPTTGGQALQVHQKRVRNLRRLERNTLADARRLLEALEAAADFRRGRALLAAAISRMHLVPLTRVLALTRDEVAASPNGGVTLWPATLALVLPPSIAASFRRFAATGGSLIFLGRNEAQPLSVAAVRHHATAMHGS
jgi:hypothetical protein